MNVSDDVLDDLLTIYLTGEASAATNALIESHARQNPAFASRIAAARAWSLNDAAHGEPARDLELTTLTKTRQFIFLRTLFFAAGILFTSLPLTFAFDERGVQFLIWGRYPGLVWSFWSIAAASWIACVVMHRHVQRTGL
jgi:hypothetical protein